MRRPTGGRTRLPRVRSCRSGCQPRPGPTIGVIEEGFDRDRSVVIDLSTTRRSPWPVREHPAKLHWPTRVHGTKRTARGKGPRHGPGAVVQAGPCPPRWRHGDSPRATGAGSLAFRSAAARPYGCPGRHPRPVGQHVHQRVHQHVQYKARCSRTVVPSALLRISTRSHTCRASHSPQPGPGPGRS